MKAINFKTGDKVNYIYGTYMRNGIVTGICEEYNRVYVTWPQHGCSSINADNLILINQ